MPPFPHFLIFNHYTKNCDRLACYTLDITFFIPIHFRAPFYHSTFLPPCLSAFLPSYLPASLLSCLSASPSFCLFVSLSLHLSTFLPLQLSASLPPDLPASRPPCSTAFLLFYFLIFLPPGLSAFPPVCFPRKSRENQPGARSINPKT